MGRIIGVTALEVGFYTAVIVQAPGKNFDATSKSLQLRLTADGIDTTGYHQLIS